MPLIPFPDPLTCQCGPSSTPAVSFGYNGTQLLPSPDINCAGPGGDTSPRDVFVVMEAPTQPGEELSPLPIIDTREQDPICLNGTTLGCHSYSTAPHGIRLSIDCC